MTISLSEDFAGNDSSKVSGDTLDVIYDNLGSHVGKVALLTVVFDNIGSIDGSTTDIVSVVDPRSNVWERVFEQTITQGSPGEGLSVAVFRTKIATSLQQNDAVTSTFASAIVAKGGAFSIFTVDTGKTLGLVASNVQALAAGTDYSVTVDAGSVAETLWHGVNAVEAGAGSINGWDVDFTQLGGACGSTGGAQTSNVSFRRGYLISTAQSETYDNNGQVGATRMTVLLAFREVDEGGVPTHSREAGGSAIEGALIG